MTQRLISRRSVACVGRWTIDSLVALAPSLSHQGEGPMLVRDVLQSKGRRIITIDCEATVGEAVAKLGQNNIGSLPVVDHDNKLIGIFSERDVLRVIHNRGEGFARMPVCDVMTRDPITCNLDDDVEEVMGLMSDRRIAKVPVPSGTEL